MIGTQNYRDTVTPEDRARLIQLFKEGMSSPAVAVKLGLTLDAVCDVRNAALDKGELTTEDLWKAVKSNEV